MIKRLRLKFVCINMAIVTGMLLVIFGLTLQFTQVNLREQSTQSLEKLVRSGGFPGQGEIGLPYFIARISPMGELTATAGGYFDMRDQEQMLQIIRQVHSQPEGEGLLKEHNLRFRKTRSLWGQTIVFVDISREIETMNSLIRTCAFLGGVSFCAFLALSFLLARWAVRPVEQAWMQQKQFVADASHELKTPLTVIMTNAELLKEQDASAASDSILTMAKQMRGLVESLLDLARVDNGTAKMVFAEVDLSELVSEGLLPFEPVYFERELILDSRVEPGLRLRGSREHLRQVLEILLDNGAKYSAPQGRVLVQLFRQGSHCLLGVSSPGQAISREDLKNIFKRFYRIDKARTGGSYGLGLSIAESIVTEHKGKIWAESAEGINTFWVQLPL